MPVFHVYPYTSQNLMRFFAALVSTLTMDLWLGVFIKRSLVVLLLLISTLFAASPGWAEGDDFQSCIVRLQDEAKQRGIPDNIIAELGKVKPIERTIQLDRSQPEFVQTFADYFSQRVTDYRIERGRELLAAHKEFLNDLTKTYGVPSQYLVSFWGLESNFGKHVGKMPLLDTLATLACDKRRSAYFSGELIAAMQVMKDHRIDVEKMQGSWAGAIGQTQFMPSAFLSYGIDGDKDGVVDLWKNQKDALTSAANYLNRIGWEKEQRWGREVKLPENFAYHLAGLNSPRKLSAWRAMGVKRADGGVFPDVDYEATLLIPSGSEGPKFLVYQNFQVILQWNRSQFYALAVGILADRINGAGNLRQPFPPSSALTKPQVEAMQTKLESLGFKPGKIDGQLGPATADAIRDYQHSHNLVADGFADRALLTQLGLE